MMKIKTSEAIQRANDGESLENIVLADINEVQVNVRDALSLSRGGIVVPEANVFYNDDDIVYDEEIDGLERVGKLRKMSWAEKAAFLAEDEVDESDEVYVKLNISDSSLKTWIRENANSISSVLEPSLLNLRDAEVKLKRSLERG